ncbi:S8/S53 family peptidase [Aquimarina sp. D1M17]|uniref:S8 family peptidase n=1 Tax=Aquimarina acroporae TaxID=2937283 RepID=UPI0020BEFD98|nr:S8/S53 family peptidase [Aquimarina acroporae]MCK8521286.1 S8/S53 family peptidase [Aquimarina acroporae]
MKKIQFLIIGLVLIVSCTKEKVNENIPNGELVEETQELLSIEEVNSYIEKQLKEKGDVLWLKTPANILWSAVKHGGGYLNIGYGTQVNFSGQKSSEVETIKENILSILEANENKAKSALVTEEQEVLQYIEVKVSSLKTIKELQKMDKIRYMEPSSYTFFLKNEEIQKNFGCARDGRPVNPNDYRVTNPGSWIPWTFDIHNIPQAWQYSTGAGITVGIIDSGISDSQKFLGSNFNDGFSTGRTVEKLGTFDSSVVDDCGHGTAMSAAIAGPRNDDAMPVGVAYNCNLVSYRGTGDVLLDSRKERRSVSKALMELADRSDVKVISMSIGWVWTVGNIKDAVKYAHSKGKMIIAAGGTSTTFTNWYAVIFPASMKETVAVTGIRENGKRCNICHDGRKIDFTVMMQRDEDSDRTMPVLGYRSDVRNVVGGSSIATATTAGIAALVWATNPEMTREQVLEKMQKAGEYYPNRSNRYGYGKIDVLKAVKQ